MTTGARQYPEPAERSCPEPAEGTCPEELSRRTAANRANAQHSTGPKTAAGDCKECRSAAKARAALNALDHGFRSQIVLQRASRKDANAYAAFLASLVDLLRPVGPLESQCVETMALADWRKRLVISKEFELQEEPGPQRPHRPHHLRHPRRLR